jgi:hypothetical protein
MRQEVEASVSMLSGYLNGTHSGPHAIGRGRGTSLKVTRVPRLDIGAHASGRIVELGGQRWRPRGTHEERLHRSLLAALEHDDVLDLILFGSIARGSTTGYSDVDAILVICDRVVNDRTRLALLRRRVLASQRAVLRYQPLQHHGFLVVPASLLRDATHALALPPEALDEACSLFGRSLTLEFAQFHSVAARRLTLLCAKLAHVPAWPAHVWELHRLISMFELLPALLLQAVGRQCAKHESFALVREEFGSDWASYEVLDRVRKSWPRERRPWLEITAAVTRNPWPAVAAFRRVRCAAPDTVTDELDDATLNALRELAVRAVARAS